VAVPNTIDSLFQCVNFVKYYQAKINLKHYNIKNDKQKLERYDNGKSD